MSTQEDMTNACVAKVPADNASQSDASSGIDKADSADKSADSKDSGSKGDGKSEGKEKNDEGKNGKSKKGKKGKKSDKSKKSKNDENSNENSSDSNGDKKKSSLKKKDKDSPKERAKQVHKGAQTAHSVWKFIKAMQLILWLKSLLQAIMTVIANIFQALFGWIIALFQTIVSFISSVIGAIASFLGVAFSIVATVAAGIGCVILCVVFAIVAAVTSPNPASYEDKVVSRTCSFSTSEITGDTEGTTDERVEKNAKKFYSVANQLGFDDVHVAGMLGNFTAEGGLDPYTIECIYDEPFKIGRRKKVAIDCNFWLDTYTNKLGISYSYAGHYKAGIGIAGFTAEANDELRSYAKKLNKDWWDIGVQTAYALTKFSESRTATYKHTKYSTPEEAAYDFCYDWERPAASAAASSIGKRKSSARTYYNKIKSWTVDTSYANSIITMTQISKDDADDSASYNSIANCFTDKAYDNSTIASAAVSLAQQDSSVLQTTSNTSAGSTADCTELYIKVNDAVTGKNGIYRSCDRCVATAVRWSGKDDKFALGPVSSTRSYVISSNKWREVKNWYGKPTNLVPGDVVLEDGHVFLYVGRETIQKVHPYWKNHKNKVPESMCVVGASYTDKAPYCQNWAPSAAYAVRHYTVYRCTAKSTSSKYKNAGASANDSQKTAAKNGKKAA